MEFLTFMLLLDLNIDCVNALLNIIPGEKFLTFSLCLPSLLNKSVSIPEGKRPTNLERTKRSHSLIPDCTNLIQCYLLRLSWSMLEKPRGESVSCSITA